MKKMRKICATAILAVMMMGMTTVYAAGISSTLSSDAKKVTSTCNSGGSGYHVVRVNGDEYHPTAKVYASYSEEKTYSGGGTFTVTHPAHEGFIFKTYYNQQLTAILYRGGIQIGSVNVTY